MNIKKIVETAMTSFVKAPTTRDAKELAQAIEGDGVGTADVSGQHVEIQHDARATTKTMVKNAIKRFRATKVTGSGSDLDARKVTESAGLVPKISTQKLFSQFKKVTGAELTPETFKKAERSTNPRLKAITKDIKPMLAVKANPTPAGQVRPVID